MKVHRFKLVSQNSTVFSNHVLVCLALSDSFFSLTGKFTFSIYVCGEHRIDEGNVNIMEGGKGREYEREGMKG